MRGPRATALVALLLLPALAGCYEEDLHVALRVPAGETMTLTGPYAVEGTLLVEEGATLLLRDADLVVQQALVVQGILRAERSRIVFSGPFERHDLEAAGTLFLTDARVEGARDVEMHAGAFLAQGGAIQARRLRVGDAEVRSQGVAWDLGPATSSGDGSEAAAQVAGGRVLLENGTLRFAPGPGGLVVGAGEARLANLTLDASDVTGRALHVTGGLLALENVEAKAAALGRFLDVDAGTARLVDSPLPRDARYPEVSPSGRLEVGWTLTARVVAVPANQPVPGADVVLLSAHEPGAEAARAVTDEKGEARLVALQYVYGGAASRPGNPHVVRASEGGRSGAIPAMVVEAPAVVLVPLAAPGR